MRGRRQVVGGWSSPRGRHRHSPAPRSNHNSGDVTAAASLASTKRVAHGCGPPHASPPGDTPALVGPHTGKRSASPAPI
ncbi:hypothetical protein PAHAL_4G335500 [Panicum hallii]|uniref:Uncharacterized protein n=1 Tax=Panicum hallii TaxID=206008 RepID=A0A2T8JEW4_9POAL|nr:hypothetical protein PAHAL_4G335500 [Panicum hallii]